MSTGKKRVLITGAAGFLGSHLCDKFVKEGYAVIGIDNFITGAPENIEHLNSSSNFSFVEHDVCQHISIDGPLDYILHFASPASPIDYLKIPIQTLKVGSLGTHNCLGLALAKDSIISSPICLVKPYGLSAFIKGVSSVTGKSLAFP